MAGEAVVEAAVVVVVAADSEADLVESSLGRLYLPVPACLLKSNREKNVKRCFGGEEVT